MANTANTANTRAAGPAHGIAPGIGSRWFGKLRVALTGRSAWEAQDPTQTWTDGGAVARALQSTQIEIERIVAENAVLSVSEYVSDAKAALRADSQTGDVIIGILITTDAATQIVEIPLRELISKAVLDMQEAGLGVNPEAQAALSGLIMLGRGLSNITPRLPPTQTNTHPYPHSHEGGPPTTAGRRPPAGPPPQPYSYYQGKEQGGAPQKSTARPVAGAGGGGQ